MKPMKLNCRFCNKQLPSSRLVDVCIRCASPWKRPLQQGQKRAAIESHQIFGLIKPRRRPAKSNTNSNEKAVSSMTKRGTANKRA